MRYAIIENGKVVNIAKADAPLADNWVEAGSAKIGDSWDGTDFSSPAPAPVTNAQVNFERDRRVEAGATFTLSGYGDVPSLGRAVDKTNLQALGFAASLRVGAGDTTTITKFRDADDVVHDLTPPQILDLWSQASTYVSAVFQASWALKDAPGGIPANYTADEHWP